MKKVKKDNKRFWTRLISLVLAEVFAFICITLPCYGECSSDISSSKLTPQLLTSAQAAQTERGAKAAALIVAQLLAARKGSSHRVTSERVVEAVIDDLRNNLSYALANNIQFIACGDSNPSSIFIIRVTTKYYYQVKVDNEDSSISIQRIESLEALTHTIAPLTLLVNTLFLREIGIEAAVLPDAQPAALPTGAPTTPELIDTQPSQTTLTAAKPTKLLHSALDDKLAVTQPTQLPDTQAVTLQVAAKGRSSRPPMPGAPVVTRSSQPISDITVAPTMPGLILNAKGAARPSIWFFLRRHVWPLIYRYRILVQFVLVISAIFIPFIFPIVAYAHYFIQADEIIYAVPETWTWDNPGTNTPGGIALDILHARWQADHSYTYTAEDIWVVAHRLMEANHIDKYIYPGQELIIPAEYIVPGMEQYLGINIPQAIPTQSPPTLDPGLQPTDVVSPTAISPTTTQPTLTPQPTQGPSTPTPSPTIQPTPDATTTPAPPPIVQPAATPEPSAIAQPSGTPITSEQSSASAQPQDIPIAQVVSQHLNTFMGFLADHRTEVILATAGIMVVGGLLLYLRYSLQQNGLNRSSGEKARWIFAKARDNVAQDIRVSASQGDSNDSAADAMSPEGDWENAVSRELEALQSTVRSEKSLNGTSIESILDKARRLQTALPFEPDTVIEHRAVYSKIFVHSIQELRNLLNRLIARMEETEDGIELSHLKLYAHEILTMIDYFNKCNFACLAVYIIPKNTVDRFDSSNFWRKAVSFIVAKVMGFEWRFRSSTEILRRTLVGEDRSEGILALGNRLGKLYPNEQGVLDAWDAWVNQCAIGIKERNDAETVWVILNNMIKPLIAISLLVFTAGSIAEGANLLAGINSINGYWIILKSALGLSGLVLTWLPLALSNRDPAYNKLAEEIGALRAKLNFPSAVLYQDLQSDALHITLQRGLASVSRELDAHNDGSAEAVIVVTDKPDTMQNYLKRLCGRLLRDDVKIICIPANGDSALAFTAGIKEAQRFHRAILLVSEDADRDTDTKLGHSPLELALILFAYPAAQVLEKQKRGGVVIKTIKECVIGTPLLENGSIKDIALLTIDVSIEQMQEQGLGLLVMGDKNGNSNGHGVNGQRGPPGNGRQGLRKEVVLKLLQGVDTHIVRAKWAPRYLLSPFLDWRNKARPQMSVFAGGMVLSIDDAHRRAQDFMSLISNIDQYIRDYRQQSPGFPPWKVDYITHMLVPLVMLANGEGEEIHNYLSKLGPFTSKQEYEFYEGLFNLYWPHFHSGEYRSNLERLEIGALPTNARAVLVSSDGQGAPETLEEVLDTFSIGGGGGAPEDWPSADTHEVTPKSGTFGLPTGQTSAKYRGCLKKALDKAGVTESYKYLTGLPEEELMKRTKVLMKALGKENEENPEIPYYLLAYKAESIDKKYEIIKSYAMPLNTHTLRMSMKDIEKEMKNRFIREAKITARRALLLLERNKKEGLKDEEKQLLDAHLKRLQELRLHQPQLLDEVFNQMETQSVSKDAPPTLEIETLTLLRQAL